MSLLRRMYLMDTPESSSLSSFQGHLGAVELDVILEERTELDLPVEVTKGGIIVEFEESSEE